MFWSTTVSRKRQFVILLMMMVMCFFCKISFAEELVKADYGNEANRVEYGYNKSPLNIRAEMSIDSEWIDQYPSGSTIEILEDCGEWYRVKDGFVKKDYVYSEIDIYQRGLVLQDSPIYAEAQITSEYLGNVEAGEELIFDKKLNGYVQLSAGGFLKETNVDFNFVPELTLEEAILTVEDMQSWNMINLEIRYLGMLVGKVTGDGVTNKSRLYFQGAIPIYDIIDGYAYFPSGRNIYKISIENFSEIQNVGSSYEIVAAYRTVFFSSNSNRKYNIRLVSSIIDGTVVGSGRTFSYNKTTGPRDESAGYKLAGVISNGDLVQDYGGGVCQVSSTIYAAIMHSSDLHVSARKPHGKEVTYLPLGMDATVSYAGVDLKFTNNFPFPIKINVSSENSTCLVVITRE